MQDYYCDYNRNSDRKDALRRFSYKKDVKKSYCLFLCLTTLHYRLSLYPFFNLLYMSSYVIRPALHGLKLGLMYFVISYK